MSRKHRGRKNPYAKPDAFTKRAKEEGYAARSVYKLDEIQRRMRPFKQGQKVVDLGCYPGSWSRWLLQKVGKNGALVGVDFSSPNLPGGIFLERSALKVTPEELLELLGGPADAVVSDMAPKTTGNRLGDHVRQIELARHAFLLSTQILAPGGTFVAKIFEGEDAKPFEMEVRPFFDKVKRIKPEAVRQNSVEFFLVAMDFKGKPAETAPE